ncbi:MAG: hypothetical protein B7Z38_00845 [Rhodobacterales bacterium 12-64-8]|nr:MAG: hypothetical protein B7Z38_00845 [Rhodobacterales bacterium 12-64-8]OYX50753.1 MAG: hypothetical protein B7Y90_02825 [Alphaproteobacteria bacterium 32-64-14]
MNKVYPLDVTSGYPRGALPVGAAAPEGENVITVQRVVRALRRRLGVMAAAFLLAFAAVAIYSFQLQASYTATSRVIINSRDQKIVDIGAVLSGMPANAAILDTEAEILRSRTLIEKVVQRLDLVNDPEFNAAKAVPSEWDQRVGGIKSFIRGLLPFGKQEADPADKAPVDPAIAERAELDSVISAVRESIWVNRVGSTFIIEISASSASPDKAALLANTLAEVYLDNQLDTKFKATRRAQEWLDARVGELRDELRDAEGLVEAHRASTGLLRTGGDTLTEQTIRSINADLTAAQADYATKSARLRNMNEQMRSGSGVDSIAEAQNSTSIANLRAAQTALSARKSDAMRRYGEKHPSYQTIILEEQDNERLINAELQRIASSLEQEVLIARERVNSLQSSLNRAKGELASNNRAGVEQAALERDALATRTLFEEFNNRFKETSELDGITEADAVVDSYAPVPGSPSFPNTNLNLMLGFMLGLALAGLVGLVLELLDNFISSPEEAEQVAGVPYIGQIPLLPAAGAFTKSRIKPAEYLIDKPHSGFAEAYRHLRASIMFADIDKAAKTVAVVSSLPSEGKTSMSYCLGRMAAMSGTKTIVIDGDIRLRQLTEISGVKCEAGLLEYLFGEARLADAVQTDEKTGLHILPLSDRKHTPRDVFGSRAFDAMLNMLQQSYDLVIIDTGPILLMAETRVVTSKVDQVVVATRWRKTTRNTLRETMKILHDFHANVAGVVLTFVDLRKKAHHDYTAANYKAYAKYYHEK